MHKYSSVIIGTGGYLPSRIVTNNELSKTVDTNDEWIISRTGIKQRHIVSEGEFTSDMAVRAAKEAIESANIKADQIDIIIVCTTTPDQSFPSVATKVQAKIGAIKAAGFDVQAVCSGFIYGLSIANSFIKSGMAKTILLIGADSMSKLINWQDRNTCVLFGDGAGAVILSAMDKNKHEGIIDTQIASDGCLESMLYTDGGVSSTQTAGNLKMLGKEVFKHAVEKMSKVILDLTERNNILKEEIDWIIPHQANSRIIEAIANRLAFPTEKIAMTLDMHANTSAATIPLALNHHLKLGKIKSNDLIALTALGGGLTWGGAILRWL